MQRATQEMTGLGNLAASMLPAASALAGSATSVVKNVCRSSGRRSRHVAEQMQGARGRRARRRGHSFTIDDADDDDPERKRKRKEFEDAEDDELGRKRK